MAERSAARRVVKDAGEVDRIRRACAIADDAFQSLWPRFADGVTERQFALELEFAMRERGASGCGERFLRGRSEFGHDLQCGGARTDNADPLVAQLVETAV